jgi:broad specificity phosphatase PhoE
MIIHMVRHGETQVGTDGLYLPDAGLTDLGRKQASLAAKRIAELQPQASYTSTLPRAIEAAEAFSKISGQQAQQIFNLCELDTGDIWTAPADIKTRIANGGYDVDFKSLGGESIEEFIARIRTGFDELLHAATALSVRTIAAFLHEGVIQSILDHLDGFASYYNDRRGRMPNGALVTVDTDESDPCYPGHCATDHLGEITS